MAWRTFLALGVVSSVAAAGCTAELKAGGSINDGGPDGTSTGGASTGGHLQSTGGSKGGSGGSTSGGSANGGASNGGNQGDGRATCDQATAPDDCSKCADQFCCQDYSDCQNVRCSGSASTGSGELVCMIDCLTKGVSGLDGGGASRADCVAMCKGTSAVLDKQTQAVISCLTTPVGDASTQPCGVRCFGADVQ